MKVKTKIGLISSIVLIFFGISACFKSKNFPIEPIISNPQSIVQGDSATVSFDFTDGDADIGLEPSDTNGVHSPDSFYYYNIYLEYFEKDDALGWVAGKDLVGNDVVFGYRIKPIDVSENTEGISGRIDVSIEPTYRNNLSSQSDTVKFKITLIDRALNSSNVIETGELIAQ